MLYLEEIHLANDDDVLRNVRNIYNTYYPTGLFSQLGIESVSFGEITVLCGDNGTGKTTLLKIIATVTNASVKSLNEESDLFYKYSDLCQGELINRKYLREVKMLTSDDIFDHLLNIRAVNSGVNRRKEEISREYLEIRYDEGSRFDSRKEGSWEALVKRVDSRRMTQSAYIRSRLTNNNLRQQSNGQSALEFWENEITENGLYLLDEPENSLSPENQLKLKQFIEESARFYHCQFIISTHSPILLQLHGARIIDLDHQGRVSRWQDLDSIRTYYRFFRDSDELFAQEKEKEER